MHAKNRARQEPGENARHRNGRELSIGQLIFDGRGILGYEAKKMAEGEVPRRVNRVLVR